MKKILSLLSVVSLTVITASSVIACNKKVETKPERVLKPVVEK